MTASVVFYILVRFYGDGQSMLGSIPRAVGPFPNAELCRLAGRDLVPADRRFWLPAEVAEAEKRDKIEADKQAAAMKAAQAKGLTYGWLSGGTGTVMMNSIPPSAITGCVRVAEQK